VDELLCCEASDTTKEKCLALLASFRRKRQKQAMRNSGAPQLRSERWGQRQTSPSENVPWRADESTKNDITFGKVYTFIFLSFLSVVCIQVQCERMKLIIYTRNNVKRPRKSFFQLNSQVLKNISIFVYCVINASCEQVSFKNVATLRDIAPCSPNVNRRFGRKYHLHLQSKKSAQQEIRL
jgi:hypothetical protein